MSSAPQETRIPKLPYSRTNNLSNSVQSAADFEVIVPRLSHTLVNNRKMKFNDSNFNRFFDVRATRPHSVDRLNIAFRCHKDRFRASMQSDNRQLISARGSRAMRTKVWHHFNLLAIIRASSSVFAIVFETGHECHETTTKTIMKMTTKMKKIRLDLISP